MTTHKISKALATMSSQKQSKVLFQSARTTQRSVQRGSTRSNSLALPSPKNGQPTSDHGSTESGLQSPTNHLSHIMESRTFPTILTTKKISKSTLTNCDGGRSRPKAKAKWTGCTGLWPLLEMATRVWRKGSAFMSIVATLAWLTKTKFSAILTEKCWLCLKKEPYMWRVSSGGWRSLRSP